MRRLSFVVVGFGLAAIVTPAHAQGHVDIGQIWQNFIASRVAASECSTIDPSMDQKFLSNLTAVSVRATQAIQERSPSVPQSEIVARMKSVGDGVHDKVDSEIKQNGCSSPKIQQLVSMYKMHAAMTF